MSNNDEIRKGRHRNQHSSFCNQYWFHITTTLVLFIICIISGILIYVLYKEAERNKERRRIQDEFKQKHGFANKLLNGITKGAKWLNGNKGQIFKEVITDMVNTIFDEE
jgi:F0F1-type ATP synthase membrane subunit a